MESQAADWLTGFGILGLAFALIVSILWILVPFAVFGIKPLLHDLIAQQKRTNELLAQRAPHDAP